MNHELISLLQCPRCRGRLTVAGDPPEALDCQTCGTRTPVVREIPRLAGDTYASSFGRQWNRYDVARTEEDEATFQIKTGVAPASLAGKLVLDAGCGGGRYSRLLGSHEARVLGVDLSAAVEKAATLCAGSAGRVHRPGRSAGPYLWPTPRSIWSSRSACFITRPTRAGRSRRLPGRSSRAGGLRSGSTARTRWPQEWLNTGLRTMSTRLPARVLEPLCAGLGVLGSVPILNRTLNKIANFSSHPDWTLRVCDNFDWYAPRYQSHHSLIELTTWFAEEGFEDISELPPAKSGRLYDWTYHHNLIIGSGVNVAGTRR